LRKFCRKSKKNLEDQIKFKKLMPGRGLGAYNKALTKGKLRRGRKVT